MREENGAGQDRPGRLRSGWGRRFALAVVCAAAGGCYGYVPMEPGAVPAGERVLLNLTRQGVADLPDQIPIEANNALRGTLVRAGADQVVVRVQLGVDRQALRTEAFGQDVSVAVGQIDDFWMRRFSPVRTGITVAAGAALSAGLFYAFTQVANEGTPGEPPEEVIRIPLFSLSVR
jgi:hypothetical protein